MDQKIKKLKIKYNNSPLKDINKLPSLEKISPIKGYTFKKRYEFPNSRVNKNISIDSLFESSKNMSIKFRNKNNSFILNDKTKKFNTGEISNLKINKSNNGIFSSYNKMNIQEIKKKISNPLKISLYPGKPKTIFQKIIENIDNIKKKNQKTYEIIKQNEKKTISLKIKSFINWKETKKKQKKEVAKVKESNDISSKTIKNESTQRSNKMVIEDIKAIQPSTTNNISLAIKKDINLLNINNNDNKDNKEDEINKENEEKKDDKENEGKEENKENEGNKNNKDNKENYLKKYLFTDMYHIRNLYFSKRQIKRSFLKVGIIDELWRKTLFIKGIEMQMNDISNKIKLIMDNVDFFKVNYFNNGVFFSAFDYMDNLKKAEFNLTLEELCFILIETVPKLLQKFYEDLESVLYVKIPDIEKEMEKIPKNEKECLELNCAFLNSVTIYFLGSFEVLQEIQKRIDYYKFKDTEFLEIDNLLDLARFDISKINSMAEIYIEKMKKEKVIIEKMEMGLGIIKKKKFVVEDIFERTHKRYSQNFKEEMKLERINSTLNLKRSKFLNDEKRSKFILMRRAQNLNLLNQPIVGALMKYLKSNIKSQIISEQVFERFKLKEEQARKKVETKDA